MKVVIKAKIRRIFGFSIKIMILLSFLCSQIFFSDIFLYRQGRETGSVNDAEANFADAWYNSGYLYRKEITIDHTKVSNTNQSNFPVLISLTDDALKGFSSGGKVRDVSGYDIIFTGEDGISKLDHELEKYVASTGEIKSWVKIPTLSASVDTKLYLYYGNASVSTSQEDQPGVWDEGGNNNFKSIWHMKEDPSGAAPQMKDSTANANNATTAGTMTSGNSVAGQVDGATSFDGSDDYVYKTNNASLNFSTQLTLGMWVNSRFLATDVFGLGGKTCGGGGAQDHHYMLNTNGPLLQFTVGDGDCAGAGNNDVLSKTGFFSGYENKWVYVTATYNNGQMILYRNGVAQASKTSVITSLKSSSANFEIGRYPDYAGFYALGSFDEVRTSNIARSADWIKTEYNNMSSPNDFYSAGMEEMTAPTPLSSWGYRKTITIDHTKVAGSSSLADFPVLVNLPFDNNLASHAKTDGADILFTSSGITWGSGTQNDRLAHEIEKYNSITGSLQAWVKIPALSTEVDTVIYMYYGNNSALNQQNKVMVWDANAKMVQHMGGDPGGSGPQLIDSTNYANDGTATGGMSSGNVVAGKWGNAISFDGTDDIFVVPANSSVDINSEITMEAWMKSSDTWNGRNIFGKNYAYALYCLYPNQLRSYIYSGGWKTSSSVQGLYDTSQWYHYVMTYNPSDGVIKLYLNGQEVAYTGQSAFSGSISVNSNPLWIGQAIGGNTFSGILEEVRLSGIVRSAGWIATEYNNGSSPSSFYSLGNEELVNPASLSSWQYRKAITIDHTKVSGDLVNFPVLVNLSTDADLVSHAKTNGNDILFVPSIVAWNSGTQNDRLAHEIEDYDSSSGSLQAWIKVPNLSSSVDTVIYMYYGNPDINSSQENKYFTWSEGGGNNFKVVQHMNQSPGGAAPQMLDSTANANNGTSSGNMTSGNQVTGQVAGGIGMDAVDDYIDIGNSSVFNSYPITLETWVKTSGSGTNRGIINKYVSASNNGYQLYINNGRIKAWYFNSTNNYTRQDADADDGGLVNDGLWHHVVYKVDSSGGSIIVDGILKNTKAWTGTAAATTTSQPVRVGQYNFYFNGSVDEVRISNIARSNSWISTEYNNQSSPSVFMSLSAQASYMDHFVITGVTSQIAGEFQEITLAAANVSGGSDSNYTGDKTITISGASAIGLNIPTFTDKDDHEVNFGSSGIISFVGGLATTTIKLYKTETAEIEISDGIYDTGSDPSCDLDIIVSPGDIDSFDITSPTNITSETSFSLTLSARDAYGNITTDVVDPTTLSITSGLIDTTSVSNVDFQDDGTYIGTITVSEIFSDEGIVLTIQNGSIVRTVNLQVAGVSHGGAFIAPPKPDIGKVQITILDNGSILFDYIPADIVQLAISDTPDFNDSSWEYLANRDVLLKKYLGAVILYIKFRGKDGGVSDVIVYERNSESGSQESFKNLNDGDIVKTPSNPDVYIIKYKNNKQYKRLILSPSVFKSYQHLKWGNIKIVSQNQMDSYQTSNLVQVAGDKNVYELTPLGDTGERETIDTSKPYDADSIYEINAVDRNSYVLVK